MAERFNISAKTFAKYVVRDRIPYYVFGRSKRFDPAIVEAYLLKAPPEPSNVVKFKPVSKRRRNQKSNSFAEALGL